MTASEIIQEALEVANIKEPKTLLERLFDLQPSKSKMKSSAIWYLTQRLQDEQVKRMQAEKEAYEHIQRANRELAKYNIIL